MSSSREGNAERLEHDEYETTDPVIDLLLKHVKFSGPVLEPACGSGRIVRRLALQGLKGEASDIRLGQDFLERREPWTGDIITNPPYHDGMADAFVARALALASGKVAMLLQAGFMFGDERTRELYERFPPVLVIAVPWRVRFYIGASDNVIRSQAYNHCWFIWDNQLLAPPMTRLIFPKLTAEA
jgi:hypothetical protein